MILRYALVLNNYLWYSYLLVLNFILKKFICLFFRNFFFSILIKSDKHDDLTSSFNKWVVLELRNLNSFNKHIGLVLTHIVRHSWVDMTRSWHVNMNCHPQRNLVHRIHSKRNLSKDSLKKINYFHEGNYTSKWYENRKALYTSKEIYLKFDN